jgi:hypothetical protein
VWTKSKHVHRYLLGKLLILPIEVSLVPLQFTSFFYKLRNSTQELPHSERLD